MKILDIAIQRHSAIMFSIDNEDCDNILYFLVYKKIEYPGDGCCAEKWLLFLIKTIN